FDLAGINISDFASFAGADDHAGVAGHVFFHARRHDRRLRDPPRDRIALHVRTHQRAVASSCSRNGIKPAETPTIWLGATSMYWIFSIGTITKCVRYRAMFLSPLSFPFSTVAPAVPR